MEYFLPFQIVTVYTIFQDAITRESDSVALNLA